MKIPILVAISSRNIVADFAAAVEEEITLEDREDILEESGIDAELIDLQTLLPWDRDTVVNSVKKTGRCVIVHEAPKTSGFGAEMSASIQERCFWHLESPIIRVTGWDTPFPHTTEWDYLPSPERISEAIKKTQED